MIRVTQMILKVKKLGDMSFKMFIESVSPFLDNSPLVCSNLKLTPSNKLQKSEQARYFFFFYIDHYTEDLSLKESIKTSTKNLGIIVWQIKIGKK